MEKAIIVKDVTKKYPSGFNLNIPELEIPSGEIIGLIGENGAGKTTLIKTFLNILKKDTGSIKIFDKETDKYEDLVKEDIGVVLDDMFLPELLTPKDLNSIFKDIFKNWDTALFYEYLNNFQIPLTHKIKTFSKGMRKKVEIAVSLAHHPRILILDEPTSGLDPIVRTEVLDLFLKFISDDEHTILFSTHITSDLEHIADEIILLNEGKVILQEQCANLNDNYGILKVDLTSFSKIAPADRLAYKKNKYGYDILVKDKNRLGKKYKDCVIDKLTLEDLMLLMIKGEK